MEKSHFLEYIQCMLETKQISLAKRFLEELKSQIDSDSEILTLELILDIQEVEQKRGEHGFLLNHTSIQESINCYEQLKFYLRRLDFDIPCEERALMEFILSHKISSVAITTVVQTSMIHKVEVLNKTAMILSEYDYILPALGVLDFAYAMSKDDTTLLNFSLVLWKYGDFENAEMVLNQIVEQNDDVIFLSK